MIPHADHIQTADLAVSVVITCHSEDRWESILDAIQSVQKQDLKPSALIVSVDHNPVLADRLRRSVADVLVTENNSDIRGASMNRNCGAALVETTLIAFLDDDETADPDWLTRLTEPFTDSQVVGTGGRYLPAWTGARKEWFPDVFGWAVGAHHSGMPTVPSRVRNVWSGNMAVRTAAFRTVGGFNTSFGKVGGASQPEDTEFCIRLARVTGGFWLYIPDARIHHAVPVARSSFRFFLRRCYSEGYGKVMMQRALGVGTAAEDLGDEKDYLRKVVPGSMKQELAIMRGAAQRLGATTAGLFAAGIGAAKATAANRRADRRLADDDRVA